MFFVSKAYAGETVGKECNCIPKPPNSHKGPPPKCFITKSDEFSCSSGFTPYIYTPNPNPTTNVNFETLNKAIGLNPNLNSVGNIINTVIPIIFIIAGFFLLFQLVSGGFSLMYSKGDQRAVEAGKSKVTNAVIGFIIIFTSYWLVVILGEVFKIDVFKQLFS